MLVVSCKKDEGLGIVAQDPKSGKLTLVELVIVEIRGDKARVGTKAKRSIPVHRTAVLEELIDFYLMSEVLKDRFDEAARLADDFDEKLTALVHQAIEHDDEFADEWGKVEAHKRRRNYESEVWQTVLTRIATEAATRDSEADETDEAEED